MATVSIHSQQNVENSLNIQNYNRRRNERWKMLINPKSEVSVFSNQIFKTKKKNQGI